MTAARSWCVALASALLLVPSAEAQETREAEIAQEQAEKAQQLTPYEPGKAERIVTSVKELLVDSPSGFYPWFGSVYSGGGLTGGVGYRHFLADHTSADVRMLYSSKNYKLGELTTNSLGLAGGRVNLHAAGGWRDATAVNYYGLGIGTSPDALTNFGMQQWFAGAIVETKPVRKTFADVGLQYESYTMKGGAGSSPSIEERFTSDTAPGLHVDPDYVHLTASGGLDTRPASGYARRGGLYALTYDGFYDGGDYAFDRLQAEVVQHVPILRENWVLSMHGVARTTLDDNDVVPYFLMPALGSGSTLRAYPSWRFRDRHSLLLSGEFRWIPNRMFLDMAIFYDAGKVASRLEDLNFSDLKRDVGVGIRFHTLAATPLRIDLAHGSEGFNLVFSGGAAF